MLIEDQRFLHEDLERLEQGISDRIAEDPRNVGSISSIRVAERVLTLTPPDQRQAESGSRNRRLSYPYTRTIPAAH
jgi:hypothetical protein